VREEQEMIFKTDNE